MKEEITIAMECSPPLWFHEAGSIFKKQVNAKEILFEVSPPEGSIAVVTGNEKLFMNTGKAIDSSDQKGKLAKDLDYLKGFLISIEKKLGNDKFVNNARPEVIEHERKKRSDALDKIMLIEKSLEQLN